MARLYNTGNYEHIRFELSAEVPKGGSVKQTVLDLGAILARLKPIKLPYAYDDAVKAIQKLPEAMSEYEKAHVDEYQKMVAEVAGLRGLRDGALVKLDDVGGSSQQTDAKRNWDDEEPPF